MESYPIWNICPICGNEHTGADDICEDCQYKIELTISHILRATENYQEHLVWEEAKGNPMMLTVLTEGIKARTDYAD